MQDNSPCEPRDYSFTKRGLRPKWNVGSDSNETEVSWYKREDAKEWNFKENKAIFQGTVYTTVYTAAQNHEQ